MKITKSSILLAFLSLSLGVSNSNSQCTWQTILTDGFEYQTVCPNLIPGATIHNTPQSFAVYTGTYSLYLNFTNCVGGSGTCPGAKVYERGFTVCRNQPLQFSSWLTTSFGGTQCNVRIEIKDGNGTVLNNQMSIVPPYAPAWIQYQSGVVTPSTDSIVFVMYTNVGGGGGNDLSMDDFLLEKCVGGNAGNSTTSGGVCGNAVSSNLYPLLTGITDTTGTWSGPSLLGGGYLGTFVNGTNQPGAYVYANHYFGFGAGCPLVYDTLVVSLTAPPAVNLGTDTTLCTNQSILLNAGSAPGNTYLWNNGVTGPNVLAFTTSTVNITNTYSVLVTNSNGCSNRDTILVTFEVCSGINDPANINGLNVYPNPANVELYVNYTSFQQTELQYAVFSSTGSLVNSGTLVPGDNVIKTTSLNQGLYWIQFTDSMGMITTRKFVVRR